MVDLSDLAKLPVITKFIERCTVTAIPAGALPKDITIQLPDADGAKVPVRYTGNPPGLAVNDEVSIRATPQDTIRYVIDGTSGATAPKVGKKLDHVLFVSTTAPNADHATIAAANTAASAGDIILLDAETWGNAIITKAVTLMGLDPVNTILTTTGTKTINVGANGVTLRNLTVANTGTSAHSCVESVNDNLVIQNCIINKIAGSGSGESRGIYNSGGDNWIIDNCRITVSDGATKYGYHADSAASSAKIIGGSFNGSTDDINLASVASISVDLVAPILDNDDLVVGASASATGAYFDGNGELVFLDGLNVIDNQKILLGTGNDGEIYSSSDNLIIKNVTSDKDIIFNINDGGVDTEVLRINADAKNVGIGIAAPTATYRLYVYDGRLKVDSVDDQTMLEATSAQAAGITLAVFGNAAAVSVNNRVGANYSLNSSTTLRVAARFATRFTTTTDATRTSDFEFYTTNAGSFAARLYLKGDGDLLPGGNKTQDLGRTGTRWNTLFQGTSTAAGSSRTFPSTRPCPVCDPSVQMIRGTGSLCILGEDKDYELAMCPICGVVATEEMKHLPPEKLAERLPAPKIEFLGFHVFAMSGNSRKVRVDFRYKDAIIDGQDNDGNDIITEPEITNSTYLGEIELSDFLAMDTPARTSFLQTLGQREWDALEEVRLMNEETSALQVALDQLSVGVIGTDLKT